MIHNKTKYHFLFALLLVIPFATFAQNTSSPYSKFGLGDLSNIGYGRNLALGGTGYGLNGANFINLKNPASLTSIDTLSTLFETGVFGKYTQNKSVEFSKYSKDGNLSHLVLAHRYTSWLMGSYGLMPYSSIGYNFKTYKSIEGENSSVITTWKGSGGINKLFYGLGLKVTKNFSLGGEAAYYFGPIDEKRTSTLVIEPDNPTSIYTSTSYHGFSYKGAFQYSANLGDKGTNITIGGSFSPEQRFFGTSLVTIEQSYSSSVVVPVYSKESTITPVHIPMKYGGGASFTWQGKYLLAADYDRATWSVNNTSEYVDQAIYSLGFEKLPQNDLKYFKRCSYRLGLRYDSGYFKVKGASVDDIRFSLGMGFPILKSRSTVNVTLEAGQRGTTQRAMLRERYTKLTVALSFHDFWFVKRKID